MSCCGKKQHQREFFNIGTQDALIFKLHNYIIDGKAIKNNIMVAEKY